MIVGIDIGGTNFRIGCFENNQLLKIDKFAVDSIIDNNNPIFSLINFLKKYLESKPDIISIGFPATLNAQRTTILQAPNLRGFENIEIVSILEKEFDCKVVLDKDTAMLLSYDVDKYHIPKEGLVAGIYFGTGIGSALMYNGEFIKGLNGTAGEIGHLYQGSDILCGCGNIGCYEANTGGIYLKKHFKTGFDFNNYQDNQKLLDFIDRMACVVSDVENLLDPHCLIIGGGIIALNGFPKVYLMERIKIHTRKPLPCNNLNIIFVDDEKEKGVLGAIAFAREVLK